MKKSFGKVLIILIAVLVAISIFSTFIYKLKTKANSKIEAMTTEEEKNVGKNGIITEAVITKTLTGTGPFDANDNPGNDSSEENNIVRSFDQVTWTIENTMSLKNGTINTGLKGGKIQLKAELPTNTANLVKWDLDSMLWAENATVSADGRTLTAYYTMNESKVSIPGKQTLVAVLKVFGAQNGLELKPTFTLSLVGNSSGEEKTISVPTIKVSAAPKYNIKLVRNTELFKEISLNGQNGRIYGYSLNLQLYNENKDKGLKGIEYPKGDITFDLNLKMEKVANGETTSTDITNEVTPILYNYKLNSRELQGQIANRPMGNTKGTSYEETKTPGPKGGGERNCYDSGNITMTQSGSVIHVTVRDYKFNGEFPSKNQDTFDENIYFTQNIGCFATSYFQMFVPFTYENMPYANSSYYLTIADSNFSATSIGNTHTTAQVLNEDDSNKSQYVTYYPGSYFDRNWLKDTWNGDFLMTTYSDGDGKAGIGQTFNVVTGADSSENNSSWQSIHSANSLLKFDGEAFEISKINGKEWNREDTLQDGLPTSNMQFQMLYAAKADGSNWSSETEMKETEEKDLLYFTSLQDLKTKLGQNAKCVGVLWESISGVMEPGTNYALGLALKVTGKATKGHIYQFVSTHSLYREENKLNRATQTRSNAEATIPDPDVIENWGNGYAQITHNSRVFKSGTVGQGYVKSAYTANGEIATGTHNGGYAYGQSLLIISGEVKVQKTVADISNGKAKQNYDIGKAQTVVTYNIDPILTAPKGTTATMGGITVTLTDTLPKGLKYINGSSNSEYGEPTKTDNADGTTTLVWKISNCALDVKVPTLNFKAAIDITSENGTSYTNKVLVETDKLEPSLPITRTAEATINIIRLASYSLYKDTETPLIEKNGEGSYNVVMLNMTKKPVTDFQLLDVLPYNGDKIGTSFHGTYTISKIELSGNITGEPISTDNLKIAVTEDESVRNNVTAKDGNLGNGGIWQTVSNGETIDKQITAFSIVGELPASAQVIAKVYIKTNGNKSGDEYNNAATAQTNPETAVIESPVATIKVKPKETPNEVVENTITKTPKADKTVNGIEVLTTENGKVTYTIQYDISIKDYEGKAKVTLVDTLPAEIDISKSNLNGGTYNKDAKTISWEEMIEGINTHENADNTFTKTIKKQIELVYDGQNPAKPIENKVKGTVTTYYSEEDDEKPGEEKTTKEAETEAIVEQEYNVEKTIEKIWDDDNNSKGERPEKIEAELKQNGEKIDSAELSEANGWKHTFTGLNKYNAEGNKIEYKITEKEINANDLDNYEISKTVVKGDTTTITNRYKRPAKIIVKHVDIDTNEDITYIDENGEEKTYNYEEESYVGDDYTTHEENIPYYELVIIPENKDGKYKEEDTTIIYYYRKLPFNIGVEKTVKEIIVNGESKNVGKDSKLGKIEIPESKLSTAQVIVKYKILVKNTGRIDGTAQVVDNLPICYEVADENPTYWRQPENRRLVTDVELKVGEEKELEVVLKWQNANNHLGITKNIVEIANTDNPAKYPDNNPDDNISDAEVIISIKTGKEILSEISILGGTLGLITLLGVVVVDIKKHKVK